jgi:hypothetical protein
MAMGESFPKIMHMLTMIINEQQTMPYYLSDELASKPYNHNLMCSVRFIQWFLTKIIKEKTGDLKFRSEWTVFRFTQGPVSSDSHNEYNVNEIRFFYL